MMNFMNSIFQSKVPNDGGSTRTSYLRMLKVCNMIYERFVQKWTKIGMWCPCECYIGIFQKCSNLKLTIELLTCGIDVITSIIHDFLGFFFLQDLGLISCSIYVREYLSWRHLTQIWIYPLEKDLKISCSNDS